MRSSKYNTKSMQKNSDEYNFVPKVSEDEIVRNFKGPKSLQYRIRIWSTPELLDSFMPGFMKWILVEVLLDRRNGLMYMHICLIFSSSVYS